MISNKIRLLNRVDFIGFLGEMVLRVNKNNIHLQKNLMIQTDIVIVGAGPVGLFAIFEAGLLKMRCHLIDYLPQIVREGLKSEPI